MIRPPRPVPLTTLTSTPSCSARARAAGLIATLSGIVAPAGAGSTTIRATGSSLSAAMRASAGRKAATNASIAPVSSVASPNTASNAPTGSVSPACAKIRTNRPSASASTSLVILSVSISVSTSPRAKSWPSATIHSPIMPSDISMPHLGMVKAFSATSIADRRASCAPPPRSCSATAATPVRAPARTGLACAGR